jgi:hypothetical protein
MGPFLAKLMSERRKERDSIGERRSFALPVINNTEEEKEEKNGKGESTE